MAGSVKTFLPPMSRAFLIGVFALGSAFSLYAAVEPAGIFSDSMVLQRDLRVPVWGWAAIGEVVTVAFNGQTVQATARNSTIAAYKGYWKAWLTPMSSGGPFTMTITGSASSVITYKGILIGDVWVCSGQSNMWYTFNGMYYDDNSAEVKTLPPDGSPITNIRMCRIGTSWPTSPVLDIQKTAQWADIGNAISAPWRSCARSVAKDFSACGGIFGVTIYNKIQVPVGLILAASGGTLMRQWISPELCDTIWHKQCGNNRDTIIVQRTPIRFASNQYSETPGGCFSGMINPIVGFGIKGVVWWQGESDAITTNPICFYQAGGFQQLIREWRKKWGQGNFPFIYNQLQQGLDAYPADNINIVRDQQMQTLLEPNTGMGIAFDSGTGMHPGKYIPSIRLSIAARVVAYGENIDPTGPIYKSMAIEGATIRVSFANASGGLVKKALCWFEGDNNLAVGANTLSSSADANAPFLIAGSDNVFKPADAVISGSTVVVSAPSVSAPKNVRYAVEYPNRAKTPLYGTISNLPASMFRTDTWSGLGTGQTVSPWNRAIYSGSAANSRKSVLLIGDKLIISKTESAATTAVQFFDVRGKQLVDKYKIGKQGIIRRQK